MEHFFAFLCDCWRIKLETGFRNKKTGIIGLKKEEQEGLCISEKDDIIDLDCLQKEEFPKDLNIIIFNNDENNFSVDTNFMSLMKKSIESLSVDGSIFLKCKDKNPDIISDIQQSLQVDHFFSSFLFSKEKNDKDIFFYCKRNDVLFNPTQYDLQNKSMMRMESVFSKYDTDKGPKWHRLTRQYHTILERFRNKENVKYLELGGSNFESLRAMKEYLPSISSCIGTSLSKIEKRIDDPESILMEQGNPNDIFFLKKLNETYGPFDIIIDDGSHVLEDIVTSFECMFPLLKDGGLYIVEDTCVVTDLVHFKNKSLGLDSDHLSYFFKYLYQLNRTYRSITNNNNEKFRWCTDYDKIPYQTNNPFELGIDSIHFGISFISIEKKIKDSWLKKDVKYKYNLVIACMFRDSAFYLKEWIEYHKLVGVEHFILLNHLSEDNFMEILQPYIDSGLVELENETKPFINGGDFENGLHIPFHSRSIEKMKYKSKWIALIDSDEFIVPVKDFDIKTVLDRLPENGSVCMNWQMHGTAGVKKVLKERLMLEMLNRKAPLDHKTNYHMKCITRPEFVAAIGVHFIDCVEGYKVTTTGGAVSTNPKGLGAFTDRVDVEELQINHYGTGDENYFETTKVPFYSKYLSTHDSQTRDEVLNRAKNGVWNEEESFSMEKFIPNMRHSILGKNTCCLIFHVRHLSILNEYQKYLSTFPKECDFYITLSKECLLDDNNNSNNNTDSKEIIVIKKIQDQLSEIKSTIDIFFLDKQIEGEGAAAFLICVDRIKIAKKDYDFVFRLSPPNEIIKDSTDMDYVEKIMGSELKIQNCIKILLSNPQIGCVASSEKVFEGNFVQDKLFQKDMTYFLEEFFQSAYSEYNHVTDGCFCMKFHIAKQIVREHNALDVTNHCKIFSKQKEKLILWLERFFGIFIYQKNHIIVEI